jgi:transcriptional regulator with XRE-family HTH domain
MTFKKNILSRITRDNSSWVEQNDYDLENYEGIRANTYIVLRIKQYMKEKGLKQNELAEILNVTPQYINKLLHGQVRNIGVDTLVKYGNKLGIRLVEIPGLSDTDQKGKIAQANIRYNIDVRVSSYQSVQRLGSSNQKYNKENYGNARFN